MFRPLLFTALFAALPVCSLAHEFWIAPEDYQVPGDGMLVAKFKNGQEFEGTTLSYFDRSSARFDMTTSEGTTEVTPRAGDSPALNVAAPVSDGLVTVVHETTPSFVTYREWPKFLKFAEHKDFPTVEEDHIAQGWPQENFRERYTRHAKALFAVGSGEGADQETGMKTEFVALTNPYATEFDGNMRVSVLFEEAPRPDAQVEVFDRDPEGAVTITLFRTDDVGIAEIPVSPGHEYLFDAVTLRPSADQGTSEQPVLWETYWAALTFMVPE